MEIERAMAGRAADDPAAFKNDECNAAHIGACAVKTEREHYSQRDQSASQQDSNSHSLDLPHFSPSTAISQFELIACDAEKPCTSTVDWKLKGACLFAIFGVRRTI
jgi:hypothetical protein